MSDEDRNLSGPERAFDLDVFNQSKSWRTRDGEVHDIAYMSEGAKGELVEWLMENSLHFFSQIVVREIFVAARRDVGLDDDCSEDLRPVMAASARLWMAETELMVALVSDHPGADT